jgi:hypothetical protein
MLELFIGNTSYSSWSMLPSVPLRAIYIKFKETSIRFDSFDAGSIVKKTISKIFPTGTVLVLVDNEVTLANGKLLMLYDTLSIF